MDVLKDSSLIVQALNSTQSNALDQAELREPRGNLKLYGAADAALSVQRGGSDSHKVALALREYRLPSPPSPQTLTEAPKQPTDESSSHAISLPSCVTKSLNSWSLSEDSDKPPFTMMEPMGVSGLSEDCLIQQSRTCLGCVIETKDASDAEPSISLKMADINREYDACSISDISMQCMSTSETGNYGDQLLSDQLLSFPIPKVHLGEKKDAEKAESDPDQTTKNLYEGLLLDKCNGEEGLLTNSNQDWGYFESFISESKMELLDLCSKNELSVNLFSEEDVDNYMFDDDDDSTLSSDVCSLKIRYESFQDNMREKTNVLQEETQFNFFPSVLVNCTKKESSVVRRSADGLITKPEELGLENESKEDISDSSLDRTLDYSPKMNYFVDYSNSAEDSGEYSDDSSSNGSFIDTFHMDKHRNSFSRKNVCSSSPLNYGLRAKRKARFSDDYLYDVDSIESERNNEKREKAPSDPKEEQDDDWCPKKRRKSSRKEPPVIIKYIIINRFKGEKHMCVKLSKIDPAVTTVSLNKDTISEYEKLAPLKDFWQEKQREQEEQLRLAAGDNHSFHLNGRHRPFSSSPPKRKYKLANRLRIQRIQTVEHVPHKQSPSPSDPKQEADSKEEAAPMARPLTIAAPSCASALDPSDIIHSTTKKSRSQVREESRMGNKMVRIRKFKSEARLRSKKMKELEESGEGMTNLTDACAGLENKDTAGGGKETEINAAASSPQLCESQTAEATEKFAFMPATCSPNNATSSEDVAANVAVIPGGYLQTLLDASDSSGGSGGSFFPQQTPRQHSLGLSLEEQQFASLQLAQSCVLSPPSESELQQSPQNCPSLTQMWHSQLGPNQQFAADIPETAILPNNFTSTVPMPMSESLPVPGYSQLGLESNRMLYEKNYMPEQALPPDAEFQACQVPCVEGQLQFQRSTLHTDNGRLISFDSVGSLSATSSNYSSLSLKSCEKDGGGEDDVNENFLAHCSPKLVIQQSIDAITPLRESTDLLDISNFTPDKFRHTSLSELSPPETPNLSPQVMGREMKIVWKAKDLQNGSEMTLEGTQEMKWNCNMIEQQEHLTGFAVDSHQYPSHSFNEGDRLSLEKKAANQADFEEPAADANGGAKGSKSKRKSSNKQTAGQGTKKSKAPKAVKGEKAKTPRQNSRASKKLKALLDEKGGKGQLGGSKCTTHQPADSGSEDWPGMGLSEGNSQADDQREFEEPSNILSNIVSGMAEVQRFMMASIEPIWGPAANICLPSEANSLKLKTLKILAGTSSDPKKKGAASAGGAKGRKAGGKGGKNQAKFNATHPFFPQLALGCNMFDKPNLGVHGINGPAHKKMYRHKTSAKFPRIENLKGKLAERDPNKDIALMTSFEKLR
ncbi:neurite extension and migration factor [Salminus brasiliensis]|uniref:neurite extension and migration factor n=1 Tax=Salminus brasiliensis TaxID=930266 RepID=UPI003B833BEE